jgi:hypothetical protein
MVLLILLITFIVFVFPLVKFSHCLSLVDITTDSVQGTQDAFFLESYYRMLCVMCDV